MTLSAVVKSILNLIWILILRVYLTIKRRPTRFVYSTHPKATLLESGVLPADWEWDLDCPQRDRREDVFLYGINSDRGTVILQIHWDPLGASRVRFLYRTKDGQVYKMEETNHATDHRNAEDRLHEYKLPGVSLEVISPFRHLRLKVRGYLRNQGTNEVVFAKMRFIWCPVSNVFDYRSDFDDKQLAISMKRGLSKFTTQIPEIENRYEQYGQLKGEVTILGADDRVIEDEERFFWGHRAKTIHEPQDSTKDVTPIDLIETTRICGYDEYGFGFSITKVNDARRGTYLIGHGYSGLILMPIRELNPRYARDNIDPKHVAANGLELEIKINRMLIAKVSKSGSLIDSMGICDMEMNEGHRGQCIIWREEIHPDHPKPAVPLRSQIISSNHVLSVDSNRNTIKLNGVVNGSSAMGKLIVRLDEEDAEHESLTGGKGSSLAILTRLSASEESKPVEPKFQVPKGLVITTDSFNLFLSHNPAIHEAIQNLQTRVWAEGSATEDALSKLCHQTGHLITISSIPSVVKLKLREKLEEIYGEESEKKFFAVRSSACGEDSEEMSAAGQMTTYLGVKGLNAISEAILKCWSSQFSPIAVEYKRSYGQLISAPMAVVVQEMVDCDTAGVLFTCDPYTGDERRMIITGNYGLGESVVSALSEPDTVKVKITIQKNSYDHERTVFGIESIEIGKKQQMIQLGKEHETDQIDLEEDSDRRNKCCLHASEITNLAQMALRILSHYGSGPKDIEWGIKDGQLYCFQCRPVTGLDSAWTEYELTHENDRGMPSEHEVISKANVGEVMGEVCSPLGRYTSLWGIMDKQMYNRRYIFSGRNRPYLPFMSGIACIAGHTFLNLSSGGGRKQKAGSPMTKAIQIAVFGHEVVDEELKNVVDKRMEGFDGSWLDNMSQMVAMIQVLTLRKSYLQNAKNHPEYLAMKESLKKRDFRDSKEFLNHILQLLPSIYIPIDTHLMVTYSSALSNMLILGVLSASEDKSQMWSDFARLISNAKEVVSADVPQDLKKLAASIDNPGEFLKMSDEDALRSLQTSKTEAGRNFKDFLETHGHRCFMEFDVQRERWAENPLSLIKSIKAMIPMVHHSIKEGASNGVVDPNQNASLDDVLATIHTPMSNFKKWLLKKFFIPICQGKVSLREQAKSFWIHTVYLYRQTWMDLAKWMTYKEGYLPDPNLLPFFTIEEIQRLLQTRDPLLVAKAKRRQKLWPKLNTYRFHEMCHGPKLIPINRSLPQPNRDASAVKITGTTVYGGRIEGRACVAVYLEEAAKQLKPGDILITYSTDIAWSPYFPALSGIATEIGGLMSHGAVIAREYGLPCIIGATGGTSMIQTGDWIELDATKGELIVLKSADS